MSCLLRCVALCDGCGRPFANIMMILLLYINTTRARCGDKSRSAAVGAVFDDAANNKRDTRRMLSLRFGGFVIFKNIYYIFLERVNENDRKAAVVVDVHVIYECRICWSLIRLHILISDVRESGSQSIRCGALTKSYACGVWCIDWCGVCEIICTRLCVAN